MKKILITILILCLVVSFGFAQHKAGAHKSGGLAALIAGAAQGDIIYWDGTAWVKLNVGSNTEVLTSNGTIPTWSSGGTGGWTDDGTDVRLTTITDNVNIGVANGTGKLNVLATTEQFRESYDALNYATQVVGAAGAWTLTTVDADGAEADINFAPDGFVGVFTVAPTVEFDVTGDIKAGGNSTGTESIMLVNAGTGTASFSKMLIGEDIANKSMSINYHNNSYTTNGLLLPNSGNIFTASNATNGLNFFTLANAPIRFATNGFAAADFIVRGDGGTTHETYVIRKHVALSGASDASATNWFTITTTNETGSADGGMYSVHVHLTAGEAVAASGAVNTASVGLAVRWTRIMASAGTGANSAVVEIGETASADEGSGAISAVTVTVTETSEFVQQVLLNVNTSGGTFDGFAIVELVYSDFTTPPAIN